MSDWEGVPLENVPLEHLDAEVWRRFGLRRLSLRDALKDHRAVAGEKIDRGAWVKMGVNGRIYNAIPDPRYADSD